MLRRFTHCVGIILLSALVTAPLAAQSPEAKAAVDKKTHGKTQAALPVVFEEDFEKGRDRWETTDDTTWEHKKIDGNHVMGIKSRQNNYKPKYRSPFHIALIKGVQLSDFELTFDVKSTKDTGGHRDCCVFFCHQNANQFYYCHLGAKPDPRSGQIMVVNNAARAPLTKNEKATPWSDSWHKVKVTRDAATGKIAVFFDDMTKPHLSVVDKTFGKGRIGIGSFDDMNDFDNIVLKGK